jgi:hypothetical protein
MKQNKLGIIFSEIKAKICRHQQPFEQRHVADNK